MAGVAAEEQRDLEGLSQTTLLFIVLWIDRRLHAHVYTIFIVTVWYVRSVCRNKQVATETRRKPCYIIHMNDTILSFVEDGLEDDR